MAVVAARWLILLPHNATARVFYDRAGLLAVLTANIVIAGYVVSAFREDAGEDEKKER